MSIRPDEPTPYRSPEETPTVLLGGDSTVVAPAPQLAPGTVLGGRYRIVAPLGSGGMGEVYRADDLRLGQTIALKFVSRSRPDLDRRLLEEVRIGREIAHPNVCRLYDVAEVDGHIFISMEFISGEDLSSLLRRVGRLPTDRAVAVAREICAGVAAAHEKGVIHRDLKPGNVMIDGRGRARITDFGLAVFEETSARHVSAGTPAYMAPEQLEGKPASIRSDVYAVGLVLYELFTGRRAFEARSTQELITRQRASDYTLPSMAASDVPQTVERVIAACLRPDSEKRPESLEHVLAELPGSDALTAAVAAGETPSPEMVAAAAARGDLRAAVAWSLLAFVFAGLAVVAVLSPRASIAGRVVDLKSADVLAEKSREVLRLAAPGLQRSDWSHSFVRDDDRRTMRYLYRQSPEVMRPLNGTRRVIAHDPPLTLPGMADVSFTPSGQLERLHVVPSSRRVAGNVPPLAWGPLLAFTGADIGGLREVSPMYSVPTDNDTRKAWVAADGQRIEAASFGGRAVYMQVYSASHADPRRQARQIVNARSISTLMTVVLLIAIPISGILIAWRNIRRRRTDYAGAFRVAATMFWLATITGLLGSHHNGDLLYEWRSATTLVAFAGFWGLSTWIIYVAIEPLVRRRWPHMLISWTRLLSGRLRDPMVGRDLLIGAALGIGIALLGLLPALMPDAAPFPTSSVRVAGGGRMLLSVVVFVMFEVIGRCIGLLTMMVILRAALRTDRATIVAAAMFTTLATFADATGPLALQIGFGVLVGVAICYILFRYGLLALAGAGLFSLMLTTIPIILDSGSPLFTGGVFTVILLASVAVYGAMTAAGSRFWPSFAWD